MQGEKSQRILFTLQIEQRKISTYNSPRTYLKGDKIYAAKKSPSGNQV
jgi:hypothetical protein